MNYKQRCILKLILGIIFVIIGVISLRYSVINKFLIAASVLIISTGAVLGRSALRGLMCSAIFDKKKDKELKKLEEMYSYGEIPQEEYLEIKIKLLNAEYDDR